MDSRVDGFTDGWIDKSNLLCPGLGREPLKKGYSTVDSDRWMLTVDG